MMSDYCLDCFNRNMPGGPMMGMPMGPMPPMMPMPTGPSMPSGAPGGTTAVPPFPTPQQMQGMENTSFEMAPGAPVQQDVNYTQGFLRTQIGKRVLVSFLIGTNTYQDRTGVLETVGISYIILREPEGTRLLCDIYSIKFVRIFGDTTTTAQP